MKKLNILFIVFLSISLTSCVDDTALSDQFDDGPNLVGFLSAARNASVVADGSETEFLLTVNLTGPTSMEMSEDITVTVEVDESSTAIEGTHFKLATEPLSLTKSTNYVGNLSLTVMTDGIAPPLATNPKLVLKITEIDNNSVVPNGRTSTSVITIEYLCYSPITGLYSTSDAEYWRIGSNNADEADWPDETEILYICDNTYRVLEYCGLFDGNEWYFEVDTDPFGAVADNAEITYLTEYNGDPILLNGQPIITCQSNPADMSNVECLDTNYVTVDGDDITLTMTYGYFTAGSGPREFYQVLNKIN